ncbi:MAG TPA: GIY-YIG nuclease family protein [Catalimonadaceae bacterium]|nr:GIY-YIG nuclease family protein [Catalimonadaceae bacterium]
MPFTYILFSAQLDKFYIGSTGSSLESRLQKHLTDHSGFTASAKDWVLVYSEEFEKIEDAAKRERQIKKWKSRKMIEQLVAGG